MAALKLLGEDTSGAVQSPPLSMFNRVSSAARARPAPDGAVPQTARVARLECRRRRAHLVH